MMEATKRPWVLIKNDGWICVENAAQDEVDANAALILRAVSTFEQAKAALGAAIETLAQSPYRTDRTLAELYARVKEVQAAMEAPQ